MDSLLIEKLRPITAEEQTILNGRKEIDRDLYTDSPKLVIDSRKMIDQGNLIQIRTSTRFIHFPKHTHNYVEVVYMCSGQTCHIINGDKIILGEGELLFLNQHAEQEILPAGENDIAVNFFILPEFFDQTLQMMGKEENSLHDFMIGCLTSEVGHVGYLHFKISGILPIQNLVENLIWTILNHQPNNRNINQITMGLLILQLLNHMDKVAIGKEHFEEELTLAVLNYIEEHYKNGELSELAEKLHYKTYWLSRTIKKLTGKTYTELVQIKRLNHALYLLDHTRLSVSDIGYTLGYDNLSYFYRLFRQKYKVTPKQYRDSKNR